MTNYLRTIALTSAATILLATSAFAESKQYQFDNFTDIDVSSGIELTITPGEEQSVRAEANSNSALSHLTLSVNDGKFTAEMDQSFFDFILEGGLLGAAFGKRSNVKIFVTLPELEELSASSGASVLGEGFSGNYFTGTSSSGARILLNDMTYGHVVARASSGSNLTIEGTCSDLDIKASSGASIKMHELSCQTGDIRVSSGASISAYATESADTDASSGGSIVLYGNPKDTDVDTSSGGSVRNAKN